MKTPVRPLLVGGLTLMASLFLLPTLAFGQDRQRIPDSRLATYAVFNQQELDQMLAPIALYPDVLLSQILMASTYPLEVVQAARWSRSNPGYQGDQAVRAVDQQDWDPSVKSLVAFPQVLELMDGTLDWTERLGNAFLSQESQLWDTVQNLRQRADTTGNLRSNDQWRVQQDGPTYIIESPRPDIIYVPYYDPLVVYGDWWWPSYAPMRWSPWAGYYSRAGYGRSYYWGNGIYIGAGFFFGGIDWRHRHANVINHNSFYYRNVNRRPPTGGGWQHDPDHRRGVPYRNPALRQQYSRTQASPNAPDTRRDYRGRPPSTDLRDERRDRGQPRPTTSGANTLQQPYNSTAPRSPVMPVPAAALQPVPNAPNALGARDNTRRQRIDPQPQALDGAGRGQDARNASTRGQASSPTPPAMMPQRPAGNPHASVQSAPPRITPAPQEQRSAPQPQGPLQPQGQPQPPQQREQQQTPNPSNVPRLRGEQQR